MFLAIPLMAVSKLLNTKLRRVCLIPFVTQILLYRARALLPVDNIASRALIDRAARPRGTLVLSQCVPAG